MKKITKLSYLTLLFISTIYSQNNNLVEMPISPTVSSLIDYKESSIDYSTGNLKLEIPLYTIKVDDFEFPIKLYYDYKGYDNHQMPTQVGYGWNIQSTGFIGVQVRGVEDFKQNGYVFGKTGINYIKPLLEGAYSNNSTAERNLLACLREGGMDGEPDKYNILLPNLNSTFYINEVGDTYTAPKDQNKIIYDINSNFPNFRVLDDRGNNYLFGDSENLLNENCSNYLTLNDVKNSYCLTKIITSKQNNLFFEYETKQIQYKHIDFTENSELYQNGGCSLNTTHPPSFCYKINTNYIKKITTPSLTMEFSYEDKDIYTSLLIEIIVKNTSGIVVTNFVFDYNSENQLIAINKKKNELREILNEFEYYGNRPKFNDTNYIRPNIYNHTVTNQPLWLSINNYQLEHFNYKLQGALRTIKYATKGLSEFTYEPHTSSINPYNNSVSYWADSSNYHSNLTCTSNGDEEENTRILTIPFSQFIQVYVSASAPSNLGMSDAEAQFSSSQGAYYSALYSSQTNALHALAYHEASYIHTGSGGGSSILYAEAGNYLLSTITSHSGGGSNPHAIVRVNYNSTLPKNYYVGGFRLKSVKKYDLVNNSEIVNYNYDDENGYSTAKIKSIHKDNFRRIHCNPTIDNEMFFTTSYIQDSYIFANQEFISPKLDSCLYSSVTEERTNSSGSLNGKTQYKFISTIDPIEHQSNSFLNCGVSKIFKNNLGALSEKIVYDSQGNIVERTKNNYILQEYLTDNLFVNSLVVYCRLSYTAGDWPITAFEHIMGITSFIEHDYVDRVWYNLSSYKITNAEYKKISEISSNVFSNGIIEQNKTFAYDENTGQLKYQSLFNSLNETLATRYFYPQDVEMQYKPFVVGTDGLIAKNMIGIPLSTQSFRNGVKLSEEQTIYANDASTNNLLLPKEIYSAKFPNSFPNIPNIGPLEKKITYEKYDLNGNIVAYSIGDNPTSHTIVIWGYNKTQPIAKIENATYSQISSLVSSLQSTSDTETEANLILALNNLRNLLPNSMVTTYTYIPLVGVSTITQPNGDIMTYDYDAFNRLKSVKDKDGNILSENEYHFKP